jgi:hemerythrin superfamily protein
MNAVALLRTDHKTALGFIPEDGSAGEDEIDELLDQLQRTLKLHTSAEAEVFYPALARFDEAAGAVEEAYLDNYAIDSVLDELSKLPSSAPRFRAKMKELKRCFERHVEGVEKRLFP